MSETKEIPLTRGLVAIVDAEDYEELAKHKWLALRGGRSKNVYYAARREQRNKEVTLILMHRVIVNAAPKSVVDHKDRNTMNNRKSNLRIGSHQTNCWNRPVQKNKKHSRFKGVTKEQGRWLAQCQGKRVGSFGSEIEAARAYNEKAKAAFGEYAVLNKID